MKRKTTLSKNVMSVSESFPSYPNAVRRQTMMPVSVSSLLNDLIVIKKIN